MLYTRSNVGKVQDCHVDKSSLHEKNITQTRPSTKNVGGFFYPSYEQGNRL